MPKYQKLKNHSSGERFTPVFLGPAYRVLKEIFRLRYDLAFSGETFHFGLVVADHKHSRPKELNRIPIDIRLGSHAYAPDFFFIVAGNDDNLMRCGRFIFTSL